MNTYIKMTAKEAMEILGEDCTVLVSVQDLSMKNSVVKFSKKKGKDCRNFIDEAKLIAKIECELRVFSKKQPDPIDFEPRGFLRTVLLRNELSK